MPRTVRASVGGLCYHVINRGNARAEVFRKIEDYAAFRKLLGEATERVRMRVLAYCLMPNHFHLALWPRGDGDLSRFMQWLLTAHVRRYHRHYQSGGHVWQGRFKAFPIQQDEHLLTALRYIERNPLRADLVVRAEDWWWSGLRERGGQEPWLQPVPVPGPTDWVNWVNAPMMDAEVEALRQSVNRGTPFGSTPWVSGPPVGWDWRRASIPAGLLEVRRHRTELRFFQANALEEQHESPSAGSRCRWKESRAKEIDSGLSVHR